MRQCAVRAPACCAPPAAVAPDRPLTLSALPILALAGLLMIGCDSPVVQGFFIPSLGPAPRWCSHLESLTEEMEEQAPTIYDDYRWGAGP